MKWEKRFRSISPKKWGKNAWNFIHAIALCFPDDDDHTAEAIQKRLDFISFLTVLCNILPCQECSQHCKEFQALNDTSKLSTFEEYNDYILNMHNNVNKILSISTLSSDDIYNRLQIDNGECSECSNEIDKNDMLEAGDIAAICLACLLLILIIVIIILIQRKIVIIDRDHRFIFRRNAPK